MLADDATGVVRRLPMPIRHDEARAFRGFDAASGAAIRLMTFGVRRGADDCIHCSGDVRTRLAAGASGFPARYAKV